MDDDGDTTTLDNVHIINTVQYGDCSWIPTSIIIDTIYENCPYISKRSIRGGKIRAWIKEYKSKTCFVTKQDVPDLFKQMIDCNLIDSKCSCVTLIESEIAKEIYNKTVDHYVSAQRRRETRATTTGRKKRTIIEIDEEEEFISNGRDEALTAIEVVEEDEDENEIGPQPPRKKQKTTINSDRLIQLIGEQVILQMAENIKSQK